MTKPVIIGISVTVLAVLSGMAFLDKGDKSSVTRAALTSWKECPKDAKIVNCWTEGVKGKVIVQDYEDCIDPKQTEEIGHQLIPACVPACESALHKEFKDKTYQCLELYATANGCMCLTDKPNEIDVEVSATSMAAKPATDRKRLVVCNRDTVDAHGKVTTNIVTVWESSEKPVSEKCVVAASNVLLPNVSMNNIETDVEEQLRVTCSPCPVTAGNWGKAPHCLLMPGGCLAACGTH